MRKLILIAALLSAISGLVCAQSPPTVINAPVIVSGGSPSGTVTISWFRTENDAVPRVPVFPGSKIVQIVNGQISTSLLPNTVMLPPGNCYTVSFSLNNGQRFVRYWSIPVSATPITNLSTVEGTIACSTSGGAQVAPGQIGAAGATLGQALVYNGQYFAPATIPGGGGGGSTLLPYTLCASSCDGTIGASPLTILATTHKQGNNAFGIFWDNSTPAQEVLPKVEAGTTLGDLKITYSGTLSRIEIFGGSSQGGGGAAGGTSGQLQINSLGSFGGFTLGGDCILTQPNMICTKTNGVPFATSATTDTTNASNIITGTLAQAQGGTGTSINFTVGSVVFASVPNKYAQDNANFFYDSANHCLALGGSPCSPNILQINGDSMEIKSKLAGHEPYIALVNGDGSSSWSMLARSSSNGNSFVVIDNQNAGLVPFVVGAGAPTGSLNVGGTSGNVLIGGITDANYRFDVQKSGSAGTMRVYDQTASTGLTRTFLRAGAAQVSSLIDLLDFQDNSGGFLAAVDYQGAITTRQQIISQDVSNVGSSLNGAVADGLVMSSTKRACWSSTTIWYGGSDTCFSRVSAGAMEINNATNGHRYSTSLQAGGAVFFDNTPTTGVSLVAIQAGAGQAGNTLLNVSNNAGQLEMAIGAFGDINEFSGATGKLKLQINNPALTMSSDALIKFENGDDLNTGVVDSGISRISAALIGIGNGTAGDFTGSLKATNLTLVGAFTSPAVTNSALTSGRVVFSTTAGLETDSANLTFNGTNLTFPTATVNSLVASVGINPSVAGGIPLGTNALPFSSVYIGAAATNNARITGTMTAARTITIPDASITLAGDTVTFCGTTTTCSATNISTSAKVVSGQVALSSGTPSTAVVISIPAYTSTTSYACSATNMTTAANSIKVVNTSTTSITLTGPNTVTDNVSYLCSGS